MSESLNNVGESDPEIHWLGSVISPTVQGVQRDAPIVLIEPRSGLRRLGLPEVWNYRYLLWFFVLKAIRGRYRPMLLGRGWILIRPLMLCLVYILVFRFLLKVTTEPIPFPLFVFTGIIAYQFFSGGITDTAASLVNNYSIMSKVYYPRLIVPLTSVIVNAVDFVATLPIVFALMAVYRVTPDWRIVVLTPVFVLAIGLATLAMGVILAALTVSVRDILAALPVVMRILVYAMPVAYPVTLIPETYRSLYYLNPMSVYLQGFRWALLRDIPPPLWSLALSAVIVATALLCGLYYFNRVERTMVDIL